jgi:hypothetical protein
MCLSILLKFILRLLDAGWNACLAEVFFACPESSRAESDPSDGLLDQNGSIELVGSAWCDRTHELDGALCVKAIEAMAFEEEFNVGLCYIGAFVCRGSCCHVSGTLVTRKMTQNCREANFILAITCI